MFFFITFVFSLISSKQMRKTIKKRNVRGNKTVKLGRQTFSGKDYMSGDGMLTTVWGPAMWHFLHTMSFNYPVEPTSKQKKQYKQFILSLRNVLPCKYCRENLSKNLKDLNFSNKHMKDRSTFSQFVYDLHEHVNKMLGKKSGLSYCDVRERYEHFRSRCVLDIDADKEKIEELIKKKKEEPGCTEPLYGKKSKCLIKIVPQDVKCETIEIDEKCVKKRIT
jgi:hypothetical protein